MTTNEALKLLQLTNLIMATLFVIPRNNNSLSCQRCKMLKLNYKYDKGNDVCMIIGLSMLLA